MNDLVSMRSNIFYLKEDEEYKKFHNLVFVTAEAEYEFSNELKVVRNRTLSRKEITVSNEDIDLIIETLKELKDKERKDLS